MKLTIVVNEEMILMSFDKFEELPEEKQVKIISAGLEVFGKYEYKKASTEEIARIAGISKGLLFYYFKNKQALFMYLLEYVINLVSEYVKKEDFLDMTDFFEIMEYGAKKKILMIQKNPYIFDFIIQCYLENNTPISQEVTDLLNKTTQDVYITYFEHIDLTKFKDDVNFKDVYSVLLYATQGYLQTARNFKQMLDIHIMMDEFNKWIKLFKNMTYKEEYL